MPLISPRRTTITKTVMILLLFMSSLMQAKAATECDELVDETLLDLDTFLAKKQEQRHSLQQRFGEHVVAGKPGVEIYQLELALFDFEKWLSNFTEFAHSNINSVRHDYKCDKKMLKFLHEHMEKNAKTIFSANYKNIVARFNLTDLKEDEGLAIIFIESTPNVLSVSFKRDARRADPIEVNTFGLDKYFRVVKLKAGEYSWHSAKRNNRGGYTVFSFEDHNLKFFIQPGKLNFIGGLKFDTHGNRYAVEQMDRVANSIKEVIKYYPEFSSGENWVNTLVPEDNFLNFYIAQKLDGGIK